MKIVGINVIGASNDSIGAGAMYPLTIDLRRGRCVDVVVSVNGAGTTIKPTGKCSYVITTASPGLLKISVSIKTKNGIRPVATRIFYVF
jgi:hypothetical protein